jgi:hypothetical protein
MAKNQKNHQIEVLRDKRFGILPWIVKFINWELRYEYFETGASGFVWCSDDKGNIQDGVHSKWRTKSLALAEAIRQAKARTPCSLRIKNRNGRIAKNGERSYGVGSESPKKG